MIDEPGQLELASRRIVNEKLPNDSRRQTLVRSAALIRVGAGDSLLRQANSSPMTLPELAIFIGRPVRLVNVVSSEMPSALQTVAMTSCEV